MVQENKNLPNGARDASSATPHRGRSLEDWGSSEKHHGLQLR